MQLGEGSRSEEVDSTELPSIEIQPFQVVVLPHVFEALLVEVLVCENPSCVLRLYHILQLLLLVESQFTPHQNILGVLLRLEVDRQQHWVFGVDGTSNDAQPLRLGF